MTTRRNLVARGRAGALVAFGCGVCTLAACELFIPETQPPGVGGAGGSCATGAGSSVVCFSPVVDGGNGTGGGTVGNDVHLTPPPAGYGFYCSVLSPTAGWQVGADGTPCESLLAMYPDATIARAGVFPNGLENSVLIQCQSGQQKVYKGVDVGPLTSARDEAAAGGWDDCIFTETPAALPVFSSPFSGTANPVPLAAFDFDLFHTPVTVSAYGQAPSPPGTEACGVDRSGRQRCYIGSASQCGDAGPGCSIADSSIMLGDGYTWALPEGTPVLAVADGTVRGSLLRQVRGCAAPQQEIYVEHAVGTAGEAYYTERFIVGYQGLSVTEVAVGDPVTRGAEIGRSGTPALQSTPSLTLVVLHLTNLSHIRSYTFQTEDVGDYGFNGVQGAIDPFGWAAPMGDDPWATPGPAPLGAVLCGQSAGAFSINLWIPGQEPPTVP